MHNNHRTANIHDSFEKNMQTGMQKRAQVQ